MGIEWDKDAGRKAEMRLHAAESREKQLEETVQALRDQIARMHAKSRPDWIPRETDANPSDAMPSPGNSDWREEAEWWQQTCIYWQEQADGIRLSLEAERHNHKKDNEYLFGQIERTREVLKEFCHVDGEPIDETAEIAADVVNHLRFQVKSLSEKLRAERARA